MPGISLVYDLKGRLGAQRRRVMTAFNSPIPGEQYARTLLLQDDFCYLASTTYLGYPVESFESGEWVAYLEGRIYEGDRSVTERKLTALAEMVVNAPGGLRERIVEWLLSTDGDFVAFILHKKTGDVTIINDVFGRLPLYCYLTNEKLILSRDLRFIANLMDEIRFDRMAIAESLWIGYLLGKRTLLDNVDRLAPATWIRLSKATAQVQVHNLYGFNFDIKDQDHRSLNENARELVALFSESCKARSLPGVQNIISLSGGFDSRAVASCFHKSRIPFRATTFIDHEGAFAADAHIAEKLADIFGVAWELFRLAPPSGQDALKLLKMKTGMNSLGMTFLLPYLEGVRNAYSRRMVFLTGDAGAQVLRDLRPLGSLEDMDELVGHLILQNEKFPLDTVIALTGVKRTDIVEELRNLFSSYPEEELGHKYIHFLLYERAFKWHSEGEDRNRRFFWSMTPFYGMRFFNYAMRCPDKQKSRFGLYREFLLGLSPDAAAVEYAGTGTPITSDKFRIACEVLEVLGQHPDSWRKVFKAVGPVNGYSGDSMFIKLIREQLRSCDSIFDYLSAPAINKIVEECAGYSREGIQNLFTITATIEDLATGHSVLAQNG